MSDEPTKPVVAPKQGKAQWIKCRAAKPCGGNHAVLIQSGKQETGLPDTGGGYWARYRCESCGGLFVISA